jgi:hypothetical protein
VVAGLPEAVAVLVVVAEEAEDDNQQIRLSGI